jgi:hypothetical protein
MLAQNDPIGTQRQKRCRTLRVSGGSLP